MFGSEETEEGVSECGGKFVGLNLDTHFDFGLILG